MSEREVNLGVEHKTPVGLPDEFGNQDMRWDWIAASDDATEALEGLVWTVFKLLREEATLNDLGGSYDSLAATPAGAALIRQAMKRDGST